MPQRSAAPVARIRHKAMALNRIDTVPGEGKVYFSATQGSEFIEWNLREGETVVFDYANFVGVSSDIKLGGLISLRISSLIMGRVVFSTAEGPGRLVLVTHGRPVVGDVAETRVSMPPSRLVAWDKNMCFDSDSNLNFVDLYLSGAYIKKIGPGAVVLDADKKDGASNGLTRFIKYFLLPV